ncbi:hypothetical protein L2K70_00015 [Nocardioides KLBMP 9356]|uniref:Lipoprotein n=1 Tax=Nocardioides potassii TaxID=2911371 RepID=A0ABS9H7I9_9ACTN|nr:hypothetical protein [Nocardioides potassii]MCF6375983.1 hypothetical protein [Nocardioides potassii]
MPSARRLPICWVVAGIALVSSACSGRAPAPAGYDRIGAAGDDVVYARSSQDDRGSWVDVVVRSGEGDNLCDARGPLLVDAARNVPALCSDLTPEANVYLVQVLKTAPATPICHQDGTPLAATRLKTDDTWSVDFVISVDRSVRDDPMIVPC